MKEVFPQTTFQEPFSGLFRACVLNDLSDPGSMDLRAWTGCP